MAIFELVIYSSSFPVDNLTKDKRFQHETKESIFH